jgi:hypothetical protein
MSAMTGNRTRERKSLVVRARERTVAGQTAFLKVFAEVGTVAAACLTSGVGRRTVYDWVERDEQFASDFEEARQTAADVLEAECRRRAVEGVAEPVYHHGEVVGYRQRYSDICLLALLSAYRPERFKHRHQHSEKDARPRATVVHVSYEKPDDVT